MVYCSECGTKMKYKSGIITEFENRFNVIDYKTRELYQCPKCKEVVVS